MTMTTAVERRLSIIVIVGATTVFGVLLLLVPFYFPTFDEAKYLGIAVNLWAGHGLTTVFGELFISHAPGWPAVIGLPQALFGVSALDVGRVLDGIAGTAMIAVTGILGWRIRPFVGAMAAASLLALVYLQDLTRTARLDVPAATFLLLYICLGLLAFRRGSIRIAIAAGLVFAGGFLIKEIDLPIAPAPFLAAILWGVPWRSLGRTGAALLAIAALGVAPWFIYYARVSHQVYRLGAPAWTLPLFGVGIAAVVVAGALSGWIADGRLGERVDAVARRAGSDGRLRTIIAWTVTIAWTVLLTYVFAKAGRLGGTTFLSLDQLRLYAATWFDALRAVAVFGGVGVILALVALRLDPATPMARGIRDVLIASICGIPLVLVVIAVGEPPRNYLANIALITILAAAGWVWAMERLLAVRRSELLVGGAAVIGGGGGFVLGSLVGAHAERFAGLGAVLGAGSAILLIGLEHRGNGLRALVLPLVVVAVFLGGTATLVEHGRKTLDPAGGAARSAAVATETAWIRANVPRGSMIAYGSFLGYEAAFPLAGEYRATQIPARLSVSSVNAPDALSWDGDASHDDWIAVDVAPRNVDQFEAFRAAWVKASFLESGATYWVYTTGIDTSSPTIEAALSQATGFTKVASWTFPVTGTTPLYGTIYRVDPRQISFNTSRLFIAPDALTRLVGLLGADGSAGHAAAVRIYPDVDVQPAGTSATAALDALKALAGK